MEATFRHRNHEYTVIREYAFSKKDPKPIKAELWKDGRLVAAGGIKDLDPLIVGELGMNHEMFRYSVMAVQGEIMGVLGLSAHERKNVFEKMFGYHHLQLVAEAAASLASEEQRELAGILRGYSGIGDLKREIGEREGTLREKGSALSAILSEKEALLAEEEELARIGREIEAEEREAIEMETEKAALAREIGVREDEIKSLQKQREENEKSVRELPRLRESKHALEGNLKELSAMRDEVEILAEIEKRSVEAGEIEKRLTETREYERAMERLLQSHESFQALKHEEERVRSEIEGLKMRLGEADAIQKTIAKKQKERADLEKRLSELPEIGESSEEINLRVEKLESEVRITESERGEIAGRIKRAEKDIVAVEKLGEICPLCKQKLTPEHRADVLKQLGKELAEAKARADALA
ncbi:MAG: hypothetical protein ACPL68_07675, partial [Candidatus Hydrothermia bacterium]